MHKLRLFASTLWLTLVLACSAWAVAQLIGGQRLETNLLALLPATERNPQAEASVNRLADQLGNRAIFLVGHHQAASAHQAALLFAQLLRDSDAFKQVIDTPPRIDPAQLLTFYAPYRAALLTSEDANLLETGQATLDSRVTRRLLQPFSSGIATPLASDPFGFWQQWLGRLPLAQSRLSVETGHLTTKDEDGTWILIIADLTGSAYDASVQEKVANAYAAARVALPPDVRILRTGGVFYGAAARSSAEHEVDLIGVGSLIGISLMMLMLFRSLKPLGLAMLTVALGLGAALATTLAVYGQLHLITLVFGASLIGEAVDYAIQYFAAQLDAGPTWEPLSGMQRIFRALLVALATSLIGYGTLAFAPFPAIGQIAVFAFAGLAASWVSVVLLLPLLTRAPMRRDANAATRLPRFLLAAWRQYMTPRRVTLLLAALLLLAAPGWWQLHTDDDIRLLINRPADLQADEAKIRALAGAAGNSRFYLVEGDNWETLLQREEALLARFAAQGQALPLALARFVPSAQRQAEHRGRLQALPAASVTQALDAAGFRPEVGEDWQRDVQAKTTPLTVDAWLASPLSTPYRYLVQETGHATLVIPQADTDNQFGTLAEGLAGITPVDKARSVSELFARYRHGTALWLPLAILIVGAVLVIRYGLRNGAAVLLPTLMAMGLALAIYGYLGLPLTLFGWMGLMLVLGVGANYAIFLFEAGDRAPAPFAGVLLSAATTLLSFGLLALSSMPALKHFGLMLLIGISGAVLLAPLALTFGKAR